jgi:hypothetical protein
VCAWTAVGALGAKDCTFGQCSFPTTCRMPASVASVLVSRYAQDVENEVGSADEETGWKLVHGDVFRWVGHRSVVALQR